MILLKITLLTLMFPMTRLTDQDDANGNNCGCGNSQRQIRIVGGKETIPFKYPWTAAIALKNGRHYFLTCGAVIISSTFVLTAAHCAQNFDMLFGLIKMTMMVNVGDHDISTVVEGDNNMIRVNTLIPHPEYNKKAFANDIALLKLEQEIVFNQNVQPVCVPPSTLDLDGRNVTVAGWGNLKTHGHKSNTLQEITVPVMNNSNCQTIFTNKTTLEETQFCAGFLDGSGDACQGDSGGPAIYKCDQRYYIVGIVSVGLGCATKNYPGIYTHVSRYADWIREITKHDRVCFPSCSL